MSPLKCSAIASFVRIAPDAQRMLTESKVPGYVPTEDG